MNRGTGFRWPWRRRTEIVRAVDDELEFHLSARAAELESEGHDSGEARLRAEREFGDLDGTRRYCAASDWNGERATRRTERLSELRFDLASAVRTLRNQPGFAAAVVGTLALGIGATTAIFALIRAVLLAPLPYRAPDQLVAIEQFMPSNPGPGAVMSPPNYFDVRTSVPGLAAAGAYYDNDVTLTGTGAPTRLTAPAVTPSLFVTLGIPAALGRTFAEDEGSPGRDKLAVLSHGLWVSRFASDPRVIGRTIRLDGEAHTVIGVMPAGFTFPIAGADLWLPAGWGADVVSQRGAMYLGVVGRLKSGTDPGQLGAQLRTLSARLTATYPKYADYLGLRGQPFTDVVVGDTRRPLLLLGAAAILLVLIAAANATNLLLARVNGRATELAVRAALGAGRRRLARQVLTESTVLGALGGVLGAAIAAAGLAIFLRLWPGLLPRQQSVSLSLGVPLVALGVSIVIGFLVGLGPARQAVRGGLSDRLRGGKQTQSGADLRLRRGLVAGELGLATVLLTGAILLVNAIGHLRQVDPGFRPARLMTFRTQLPGASYPTGDAVGRFYDELLDRIAEAPGVDGAAAAMILPLSPDGFGGTFTSTTPTEAGAEEDRRAQMRLVTRDYFRVMGIPIQQGRSFLATDRRGGPAVLVVSGGFSKKFWPASGALGKTIKSGVQPGPDPIKGEIVGIAGDVRASGLHRDPTPVVYVLLPQVTTSAVTFVVRTTRPAGTLIPAVKALIEARDRDIVLDQVATMDEVITRSLGRPRFIMELLALFAGLAVVLATVGIYGVVSYAVAERTREIGVRIALGANRARVTRTVVAQELRWAAAGLLVGSLVAAAVAPLLASAVFGIDPAAPVLQALAAVGLLLVATAACLVPALRAARINPLTAIRAE